MGALSALPTVEDSNKVFQKVNKALAGASPSAQKTFRGLKEWLVEQKGNPNLRVVPFSSAGVATADDGQAIGAGTAKVYGVYFKKPNDATAAYVSVVDNGTDDNYYGGSLTGSVRIQAGLVSANQEFAAVFPNGLSIALGLRIVSTTAAAAGTTANTAASAPYGFVLYGSA